MVQNAVLVVDDDNDDIQMIQDAWKAMKLERPVIFFKDGKELIKHLKETSEPPFLVLCDMNLIGETGFDIKKRVTEDPQLKYKSTPFLFWSTDASEKQIQFAYDLPAQGFFLKPHNVSELHNALQIILNYWEQSMHPKRMN